MRWAGHQSRRFGILCGAWVGLVGATVVAAAAPAPNTIEHVSAGDDAGNDESLAPTVHPPVPRDLSLLWLAPTNENQGSGSAGALSRLASGVTLYQQGKYADALARLSSRTSSAAVVTDYAAYYTALAQLKLGRLEDARRGFAAITGGTIAGYLSEAAALGEAEAAEAARDHATAQRVYERLLTRSLQTPDQVWLKLGRASLASGDRARAVEAFRHVRQHYPFSSSYSEATSELGRLHAMEPLTPNGARYRAELARADGLFDVKRYGEARAAYERLQPYAAGSERERLFVRRAACDYFDRRYAAARSTLAPYLHAGDHRTEARFYDLMAARAIGAEAEFVRLSHAFVNRSGDTAWAEEVLDTLATHFIRQNQDTEADTAFRTLLQTFPTGRFAERASWKVGWRAYRKGSTAEAAQVFERAATAFVRSDYRPAYLYWAARARELLGEHEAAAAQYGLVRTDYHHSYYGRLADGALGRRDLPLRASVRTVTSVPSVAATTASASLPPTAGTIRLLLSASLYDDALNEVRYAQRKWGDSPVLRATIAWLHHQKGELLVGANALKRAYPQYIGEGGETLPSEVWSVMFPLAYWNVIRQHATRLELDPYLVAALVAQESAFIPDIRSPAKAAGLMQLMPATAQRYARKLALEYSPAIVTRAETNIRLGTAYFADLVREFGDVHLALASYNAGESRVRRWVAERSDLSPDEFIDDIPFPETQNYVKKILGAADNYRRIYGSGVGPVSDPDRAIPTLASRRFGSVRGPQQVSAPVKKATTAGTKAKPAAAAAPATRGSVKGNTSRKVNR